MRYLVIIAVCCLMLTLPSGSAKAEEVSPWDFNQAKGQPAQPRTTTSPAAQVLKGALWVYREFISGVLGSNCPSYPSCSAYSREAIARHGAVLGTLLTVDRLIHEPTEMRLAPQVMTKNGLRAYDPVSANDCWFRDEK